MTTRGARNGPSRRPGARALLSATSSRAGGVSGDVTIGAGRLYPLWPRVGEVAPRGCFPRPSRRRKYRSIESASAGQPLISLAETRSQAHDETLWGSGARRGHVAAALGAR